MKSIYLLLTATGTWFSRFVGLFTKARYNHISLCLNDNIEEFYSFGRKIAWFPLVSGFVIEQLDRGVFKVFSDTACLIYKLEINDDKYEKLKTAIDLIKENQDKYGFNLIGMIGVIFNKPIKRKNRFFCTQFVATMLSECNIHDFKKDMSLINPHDFHKIPGLIKLYEGRLSEFSNTRGKITDGKSNRAVWYNRNK